MALPSDVSAFTPSAPETTKRQSGFFKDPLKNRAKDNAVYPSAEEHADRRLSTVISGTFTPQSRTNLPFILRKNQDEITQLHFGTQARRIDNDVQVSNTFKLYLAAKLARDKDHKHIYFNKLSLNFITSESQITSKLKRMLQYQRVREYHFTKELHAYADKQKNLYMVTMPADKGRMDANAYRRTLDKTSLEDVKQDIASVLNEPADIEKPESNNIKDFYLGKKVRESLYKDKSPDDIKKYHQDLIEQSIQYLGLQEKTDLCSAEKQAVFFHTFMFTLTDDIISNIGAKSMGFSCKDAIDRAKAHYAYYNLVKSFATSSPWGFNEFNMAIHGTSAMVKARGMNHHHTILWNAIDVYVTNNYSNILNDPNKYWLIEWRNYNCPAKRVKQLLDDTIAIADIELKSAAPEYQAVLEFIKKVRASTPNCSNSLLTILTTTMALNKDPNNIDAMQRRKKIIDNIPQNNPYLIWLQGLLLIIWGKIRGDEKIQERGISLKNGIPNYESFKEKLKIENKTFPSSDAIPPASTNV